MKMGLEMFQEMKQLFMAKGQEALYMSHYDLAEEFADYPVEAWRAFVTDDEIQRYISKERSMLSDIELNKLMHNASSKGGQVGAAQLVSAMAKLKSTEKEKDGPIFIYNAVPLNAKQKNIDSIEYLEDDPFNI